MAGIKTTYGKRRQKAIAFSSMTDLFTSSTEKLTDPKPTSRAGEDPELCAKPLEMIQLGADQIKGTTAMESKRQQRALRPIDINVARSPFPQPITKQKSDIATTEHGVRGIPSPCKVSGRRTLRMDQKEAKPPALHQRGHLTPINEKRRSTSARTPETHIASTSDASSLDPRRSRSTSTRDTESKPTKSGLCKSHVKAKYQRSDQYAYHTRRLLRLCSDPVQRSAPRKFSTWAANLEPQFHVIKIAEASYGEVYRLAHKEDVPGFTKSDESVFKMIALKPPEINRPPGKQKTKKDREREQRIESMSSVESVHSEVKLLQRMSEVPGFTNFREIHVLQGAPSEQFVKAWRDWNDVRTEEKQSIFADPGIEGSYDETQLWAVIEMQDAGSDLEEKDIDTVGGIFGIWDIFWGVVLALGKGEEEAQFEHRDLHMGNICIRPINSNNPIAAPTSALQLARKLNFTGLETTLIDYTLSRAQMTSPSQDPEPTLSNVAFEDLEPQEWLFEADASEEYQYEIYRYMRGAVFLDDPLADVDARADEAKAIGRTWAGFHPQTNLMWLHFILHEMMDKIAPIKETKKRKSKGRATKKKGNPKDDASFDTLLAEKKQELDRALKKVQELLDPENVPKSGIWSAKDLVALAMKEGWLDEKDVIAGNDDDFGQSRVEAIGKEDATSCAASPVTQAAELLRASRL